MLGMLAWVWAQRLFESARRSRGAVVPISLKRVGLPCLAGLVLQVRGRHPWRPSVVAGFSMHSACESKALSFGLGVSFRGVSRASPRAPKAKPNLVRGCPIHVEIYWRWGAPGPRRERSTGPEIFLTS